MPLPVFHRRPVSEPQTAMQPVELSIRHRFVPNRILAQTDDADLEATMAHCEPALLERLAPRVGICPNATTTPIREAMLKQQLRPMFPRLDAPLPVEGPDGRSKALVFALARERNLTAFSIVRLAVDCCEAALLLGTWRV